MNDEVMRVKITEHDNLLKEHGKRLDKIEQECLTPRCLDGLTN